MPKYTDEDIRNMSKITCKIAADYLGISPMAVSIGMRNDLLPIGFAKRLDLFLMADDREVLQDAGKITAEIAKAKAETEFEKYRVIQDRLFMSDFDKYMLELEKNAKK